MTGKTTVRAPVVALMIWLTALHADIAMAADADMDAADVIAALGLVEATMPVRERSGWRSPTRIVVRADDERLAWLQAAVPDVELVAAITTEAAVSALPGADGLIGFCSEEVVEAGAELRWIQLPYAGAEG